MKVLLRYTGVFLKLHQPTASPPEIMRKLPQPSVSLAKNAEPII